MKFARIILASVAFLCACSCSAKVKEYRVEVVATYSHDTEAYTQGLFFYDGKMYESTGQYGSSSLRIVDPLTGEVLQRANFSKKYFMEGSVVFGGQLYLLTWTNRVAYIYDCETLEYVATYSYPREGWGLTTDGKSLIASDGSANLYFMDKKFAQEKKVTVKMDGHPVRFLNELEYIDGKIWANVYTTDLIVIINPKTGEVEATVDASGLLSTSERAGADVLNGIAYNSMDGRIYLTGKYWPYLYQIKLVEK